MHRRLGIRPSFPHQRRDATAEGQIHPLDKRGLDQRLEPLRFQHRRQRRPRPPCHPHHRKLCLPLPLDQLPMEQIVRNLPVGLPLPRCLRPLPEMRGQSVEVCAQTIRCEGRNTVRRQNLCHLVHKLPRRLRCPGAKISNTGFAFFGLKLGQKQLKLLTITDGVYRHGSYPHPPPPYPPR